ncbi:hypothetical protein ACS0TY_002213 [Phlomoides rotata]
MVQKRQLRPGGEEGSNKRRNLASTICKGLNHGRNLQESVSCLEPLIRKWVQEAVECALNPYMSSSSSSSYSLVEPSVPSRSLQLQFKSNFPNTMFTGNRLMSADRNPVQVVMYDSVAKEIITCGPLSSLKVTIAVLDGDFDREDWTTKEFDRKLVKNREGKRPLIAGELIVTLKNGVGYIGDVSFTDNSSWIRNGKFRLAAKANITASGAGDESIREAVSNAFRVKDHRGESYQKHYPPCLDDEVWRLEKIAKDGRSHQKLNESRIYSVGDFLRFYATDHHRLRDILAVSDKKWEIIIRHAMTCNSDGNQQHPVKCLTNYPMSMLQDQRQNAYRNPTDWTSISGYPILSENSAAGSFTNPNLGLHVDLQQDYQREMGMNGVGPTVSSLSEVEQDNCSFQLGESAHSTLESFNPSFRNSFQFADSPGGAGFCIGGSNFMGSQLSSDTIPPMDVDNYFMFLDSGNNLDGIGRTGTVSPRSKARWCKVLAVVKWRILVRRNVAARKWKSYV